MPDPGLLLVSGVCVVLAVLFFLAPGAVISANRLLNRTLTSLDEPLMRYRYVFGALLAVAAYSLFRIAMLISGAGL